MNKRTLIVVSILNAVLIVVVGVITYAWYEGVLDTFDSVYSSFNAKPSSLLNAIMSYTKYAWVLPLIDTCLLIYFIVVKQHQRGLWGLMLFLVLQIMVMIYIMYSGMSTMPS